MDAELCGYATGFRCASRGSERTRWLGVRIPVSLRRHGSDVKYNLVDNDLWKLIWLVLAVSHLWTLRFMCCDHK